MYTKFKRKQTQLQSEYLQIISAEALQNKYFDQYLVKSHNDFELGWDQHAKKLKKYLMKDVQFKEWQ